jgi:hypothetical protein
MFERLLMLAVCATVACTSVVTVLAQTPAPGGFAATHAALRSEVSKLDEEISGLQRSERYANPKTNSATTDPDQLIRQAETVLTECREFQKAANETAEGWKPIGAQVRSAEQAAGETRQGAASIRPWLGRVDQLVAQLSKRDQASEIVQRFETTQATLKRSGERLAEARRLNNQAKEALLKEKQSAEAYAMAQRQIDVRIGTLKIASFNLKRKIESVEYYETGRVRVQRTADDLVAKLQQLQTSVRGKDAKAEQAIADTLADARAGRNSNLPSYAAKLSKLQSNLDAINKATASIEADAAALRDQRSKQSKFADEAVAAAENAQFDAEIRLAASRPAYEKALEFLRRNPEAGVVPDVVTKPAAEACQLVLQAKFTPGTEFVRTGIPAGREGTVFEQSLPAGTRVPEGTNVILKIYGTVVPSVLGWRVPTAGDILGEVGLSLDKVTLDRTAPSEQQAERIYWQDPPAGSPIRPDRKLVDVRAYAQWKTSSTTPPATAQLGFQPGDGALIHPRFATAAVIAADVQEAGVYGDRFRQGLASAMPGSFLHYRRIEHHGGDDHRNDFLWIYKHQNASDARKAFDSTVLSFRDFQAKDARRDGDGYVSKVPLKRLTETEGLCYGVTLHTWRDQIPKDSRFFHHVVIYRDVFFIDHLRNLGKSPPTVEDLSLGYEQVMTNIKKLIDLRFPKN